MKIFRKEKLVRELRVSGTICGARLDKVELDCRDILELSKATPEQLKLWIEKLLVRIPSDKLLELDGKLGVKT